MTRAQRVVAGAACGVLLIGPTVMAFFAGGYFSGPRAWAGLLAWLAVLLAVIAGSGRLPRGRWPLLAIGGLASLAVLDLLSMLWASVVADAYHAGQIGMLYLGALLAAALLFSDRRLLLWVEPVLAAGAAVVVGYGLAGRFLPGLLHFSRSQSAQGRLEQPLTYWNAMGELAALGLVLCARLMGDRTRPAWVRWLAAAATAPLGMGLYISFSRGAIFAAATGLLALVVLAPRREQLVALLLSLGTTVLAALCAAPFSGVTSLQGSLSSQEQGGAIAFALVVILAVASATVQARVLDRLTVGGLRLPRWAPYAVGGLVCVGLGLAVVLGAKETNSASQTLSGGSSRLVTLQSNRYAYWDVALRAFRSQPLHGVGAGNWNVYWLKWRHISEFAQDAHSLPLQTLAELGILGALALLAFLIGMFMSARAALAKSSLAAGPVAGFIAYIIHAPLDWDWQLPALTLVGIVLAGAVLGATSLRDAPEPARSSEAQTAIGA